MSMTPLAMAMERQSRPAPHAQRRIPLPLPPRLRGEYHACASLDRDWAPLMPPMKTIQIALDDKTLQRARELAKARNCTVEELVTELLGNLEQPVEAREALLGLLAAEPEVADQVAEGALAAREKQALRLPPP